MTTNMSYIDNRSYEEHVAEATPTGAYELIVNSIVVDSTRSDMNLYREPFVWYETELGCLRNLIKNDECEVKKIKMQIDESRGKIDKNIERINNIVKKMQDKESKVSDTEKKDYKVMNDMNKKLDMDVSNLIDQISIIEQKIITEQNQLFNLEYREMVSKNEYYGLRRAKNEYNKTKDIEYLRKAVHFICAYADKLRYGNNYIAPYLGHPLDLNNSPFSAETTYLMNRRAYIDYSAW
jgi:hypothetical protein